MLGHKWVKYKSNKTNEYILSATFSSYRVNIDSVNIIEVTRN